MYPRIRLRRKRNFSWLREMVCEHNLTVNDLILPIFVKEGNDIIEPIISMPDVYVYSMDKALNIIKEAEDLGINAVMLFPRIEHSLKDEEATEAYNPENLICRTIRYLKNSGVELGIISDVALDPYTIHGHDGIINNNYVDNDISIEALKKQALTLVKSGADIIAPSDMMDGRIGSLRDYLNEEGFYNIPIISYSTKFASNLYGPFRDAVGSSSVLKTDKKTYQMDYRNSKESLEEVRLDIQEGADIILVKPATWYLDIIKILSESYNIPVFAYHVSGEYSSLKIGAKNNLFNYENALLESLISIKRAGASSIVTYGALDVAKILLKDKRY